MCYTKVVNLNLNLAKTFREYQPWFPVDAPRYNCIVLLCAKTIDIHLWTQNILCFITRTIAINYACTMDKYHVVYHGVHTYKCIDISIMNGDRMS